MLKNYFKLTIRHLLKYRAYSFINIAGLAVGMTCCILILLYVGDELRYDRFHERADRIYRLTLSTDKGAPTNANTSFGQGPALAAEFPEIEAVVRFRKMGWGEKRVFAHNDKRFYEEHFFFADKNVFDVFTFPFLRGNAQTALAEPFSIVITEAMSQKYFGHDNPLGETISLDPYNDGEFTDYKITGVVKNLPHYSHIKFDLLASFESQKDLASMVERRGWGLESVFTYVLFKPGAHAKNVEAGLPAFLEQRLGKDHWYSLHLQPLTEIRLHSKLRAELEPNGDIAYVYIFSAIAAFILLIACINFMNLATARSQHRAKEVGVRKVAGVPRSGLVAQFLGEALLMALIALFVAAGLVEFFLPVFNALSGKILEVNYFQEGAVAGGFVAIALLVGILAGSYPAFFLSRFQPVEVLKGRFSRRTGGARLRQALVVAQFTISIALIAGTVIIHQQLEYMRNKKLGFDKEQVVVVPLAGEEAGRKWPALKTELLRHPEISHVTASTAMPADEGWWQTGARSEGTEVGSEQVVYTFQIDYDFMKTLGIELVAGRDFSPLFASDSSSAFILNEAAVKKFGWASAEAALGQKFVWMGEGPETPKNGTVIGVTKDFHYRGLHEAIAPAVFHLMPYSMDFLALRIPPRQVPQALAVLKNAWAEFDPERPLEYSFLDDKVEALYQSEETLQRIVGLFSALAIFVAGLGLFGLASFTTEQRTKEIGVRKALGASVQQVVLLLSKEFTRLVAIAFLLAAPVAYFAMNKWLQGFAYRTELSPGIFVLAGVLALLIAWLTVSYQAIKAALTNPVEALRYE